MRKLVFILAAGVASLTCAWGQYLINSIAGNGTDGATGDGGPASQSEVSSPNAIAMDAAGKIYIADSGSNTVRVIGTDGKISTFAGNGVLGFTGDGAAATTAAFAAPGGVAVDAAGHVYISDSGNHVVRIVTGTQITTYAGNATAGGGYSGDGGQATSAQLYEPAGLAVDSQGNLYIADTANNQVRVVGTDGIILSVGQYVANPPRLNHPSAVAVDAAGNVFIADSDNNRILEYSAKGVWSTVAGNGNPAYSGDNGPATKASLSLPHGLAVDAAGQLYISDSLNQRIRMVSTAGTITTVAGNGQIGYRGDGGSALSAAFNTPHGITVDPAGNIYVADTGNHRVREVIAVPSISQNAVVNAASFAPQLAPGELATVFGQHLSAATVGATLPLQTTLGGTSVSVNGSPAPLLYVNPNQVNFQVPGATAAGNATVTVTSNGFTSANVTVPVMLAAPGIFQYSGGRAVAQNGADSSLNTDAAPAKVGSTLVVYLTGAGPYSPTVPDGAVTPNSPLSGVTSLVSATIGSAKAQVSFTGLTPGFVGLEQANIVVPAGLTTGDYPLTITVNGQASNSAMVSVAQ